MADILNELKITLANTQEEQINEANKYPQPHTFREGDMVFISTKDLPLTYANSALETSNQSHRKTLQHKYIGEFQLGKQRGENAFEVLIPEHWKLSRTFNVSKLKPSRIDNTRQQAPPPPMRTEIAAGTAQAAWEVEKIIGMRRNWEQGGREEFEVIWKGFEECTWEPADSFTGGGEEILTQFRI